MAAPLAERLERRGERLIRPREGLDALFGLLGADRAHVAVAPVIPSLSPRAAADAEPAAAKQTPPLCVRLRSLAAPEREPALRRHVATVVRELIMLGPADELDDHAPLSEVGIDSLMVVELRNRLQRDLEVSLPALVAFDHPTVAALSAHLLAAAGIGEDDRGPRTAVNELRELIDQELELLADDDSGSHR